MKNVAAISLFVLLAGCMSGNPNSDITSGDAEKFINRSNADFAAAAGRGDVDTMMKMYAADAVLLPPNEPSRRGTNALREYWSGFLGLGKVNVTLVADDVMQSCDMATEIGTYKLSIAPPNGAPIADSGKYVVTWRKTDGRWRAVADIFNSDLRK